jgi:hypothetical protein
MVPGTEKFRVAGHDDGMEPDLQGVTTWLQALWTPDRTVLEIADARAHDAAED